MNNLPFRLKKMRESLNLSTKVLAMDLNFNDYKISEKEIIAYENGEKEPSVKYLQVLVEFLGVNSEFLIGKSKIILKPQNGVAFVPILEMEDLRTKESCEKAHENATKFCAIPEMFYNQLFG